MDNGPRPSYLSGNFWQFDGACFDVFRSVCGRPAGRLRTLKNTLRHMSPSRKGRTSGIVCCLLMQNSGELCLHGFWMNFVRKIGRSICIGILKYFTSFIITRTKTSLLST